MAPPQFIIIPTQILQDKKIQPLDQKVYGFIYSIWSMNHCCFSSNKTLAVFSNSSTKGIENSLTRLEKGKYIKRVYKGTQKRNRVEIVPLVRFTIVSQDDPSFEGSHDPSFEGQRSSKKYNNILGSKKNVRTFKTNKEIFDYLKGSKNRKMRIIGWYAELKNIDFLSVSGETDEEKQKNSKKKLNDFIQENIVWAQKLEPYKYHDLERALTLACTASERGGFEWKLSTIYKKIEQVREYFK